MITHHSPVPAAAIATADIQRVDEGDTDTGGITATIAAGDVSNDDPRTRVREVSKALANRFAREGRWPEMQRLRDDMMAKCRARHMPTLDAQVWTYAELERLYPPLSPPQLSGSIEPNGAVRDTVSQPIVPESSRLSGLGDIPSTWPALPANSSLSAEISWVQANRLYVVEERGNTTIVHLDRAHEPAPSRAAIGWLETSIRSYAKFVDVVSRAMTTPNDEHEQVRRERMAIDEIRALLDEMHRD